MSGIKRKMGTLDVRSPRLLWISAAVVLLLTQPAWSAQRGVPEGVRSPAVAGAFYPDDPKELKRIVRESLRSAKPLKFKGRIKAIMAPHAGYVFCRKGLGAAYRQIQENGFPYKTVILIGPSHRVHTKAAAVSSAREWGTPLGSVKVDMESARKFVDSDDRIEFDDRAHMLEHSLEVQLPFLLSAAVGKPFKIVPIITNSGSATDHDRVARCLVKFGGDPETLIVLSTDLSHYPDGKVATKVDKQILDAVCSLDTAKLVKEDRRILKQGLPGLACTMCGLDAACCLQRAAGGLGITGAQVVSYSHSGMVSGDSARVVGYGAVVYTSSGNGPSDRAVKSEDERFSEEAQRQLTAMARSAVKASVTGEPVSSDPADAPDLQEQAGCFVTLKNKGVLRGCIGRFTSDEPLWKTVREMAVSAATRDGRFKANPITAKEVPDLSVEVSVLSRPRLVQDPLTEVKLGIHGIIIRDRGRSGTFLPQVATDTGWSLEEFLGHCSRDKAGLGWEGWKKPSARVYTYTATIVEEKK